ncbi:MAG: DUF3783 domain-containing protein [Desulfosudaceae bacterium]
MNGGTFQKVGQSEQRLYGPRAMLVCGFALSEQEAFADMLARQGLADVAVIAAAAAEENERLGDLLARPDRSGRGAAPGAARAVIMAGITEQELHQTLSAYRELGLARPLWATLTPHSENWTLAELLAELAEEHRAMEKKSARTSQK